MSAPEPLDRRDLQQRVVRGALWTGVHTLVSLPLAFGVNIVLARMLGVADYGRLTYLTTIIGIAGVVAGLGVTTALIQFGAKAHAKGNAGEVGKLLSASQGFRLFVSGPIIALAVIAFVRVDWWLLTIALLFGVGAPAAFGNARPALTIENRTDKAAQLAMVGNIVLQAAVVLTVVTLGTADAVWSVRTIATGMLLALPLAAISARYRTAVLRPTSPRSLPRAFWAFAIPTGLAGIIGALVMDRTEVVILDWFADERAMGLFGLAFGLAGHAYAPAQAFIGPLVPAVSALAAVDQESMRRAFLRSTRVGSAICGLLLATALPTLACLVPVIYGSGFADASDLLIIMGIGSATIVMGSPHTAFLMARLGGRRLLRINLVSLAINGALALLLIPTIGATGAAIACSGTFLTRTLQLTFGEARALEIPMQAVFRSIRSMLVALSATSGLWLLARFSSIDEVPLAVGTGLAGFALYIGCIKIAQTGLTNGDVEAILQALPRRLQGARFVLVLLRGSKATS